MEMTTISQSADSRLLSVRRGHGDGATAPGVERLRSGRRGPGNFC
jgi:hypothetical protein